MIPLVDPDLSQEETVYSIIQSTVKFSEIVSDVFTRLDRRLASVQKEFQRAEGRYETVKRKIDALKQMDTAVVLRAPSRFPNTEYLPGDKIIPFVPGVNSFPFEVNKEVFNPRVPAASFDLKSELEQRKQFFAPGQLMQNGKIEKRGRAIPKDIVSVADLFYEDSDQPAFDGVGGSFLTQSSKSKSVTSKVERKKNSDYLDRTAIGGRRRPDDDDLFAFRPSTAEAPELDLPDFLPDLPGVALDVVLTDLPPVLASTLPDIDDKSLLEIPTLSAENNTESPSPVGDLFPVTMSAPPPPPPPPMPVTTVTTEVGQHIVSPPPLPSVFAPPAPPPPPPIISTPVMSPADFGGRADLMAAIRSAGGVSNMKLKSVKNQPPINTRKEKEKQSLRESSALPSSSGGGDLMSSLAKALESRRKAIAGSSSEKTKNSSEKPGRLTGAMSRISDMIPAPPVEDNRGSESGDDEWT